VKVGFSFPRRERLKGREEIQEVFNRKMTVSCSGARLFWRLNGLGHNRVAFTFARKFGNAVARNHSKRLSREAYRLLRNKLRQGYDLVLLVYPGCDTFSVRMEQLQALFTKAGLISLKDDQKHQ